MVNQLAASTSPYLLQHAENPVDWLPWSAEALAEARVRGVPVFLSIGYSTCHWCHVMAHESFEDRDLAAVLNAEFVPVKVDREERPDIDALYLTAAQALGGGGGWPLSVFLTPEGLPFYAGTYFPPAPRGGMPSFRQVLAAVTDAWGHRQAALEADGAQVADAVRSALAVRTAAPGSGAATGTGLPAGPGGDPDAVEAALSAAADRLAAQADTRCGGFGGAPKFPMSSALLFLQRHGERTGRADLREVVERTLTAMADGGIHDQLGGGFARYTVDAEWRVPHFEKTLYDNAQLLGLYAEQARRTGDERSAEVARGIVRWLETEMRTGSGAYASALDADSDGAEGRFYVWTPAQLEETLGAEDAALAARHLGVSGAGDLDGASVLHRAATAADLAGPAAGPEEVAALADRLSDLRGRLFVARAPRERPDRDDKVITAWNGLAIGALARAGRILDEPSWIAAADRVADAVLADLVRTEDDGSLAVARSATASRPAGAGTLEDYAGLARGLLELYAASGAPERLETAAALVGRAREVFRDPSGAGWVDAVETGLFARARDVTDGATPSGNALLAESGTILAHYAEDDAARDAAFRHALGLTAEVGEYALHAGFAWSVVERLVVPPRDLVLAGSQEAGAGLARAAATGPDTLVVAYPDADRAKIWPLLAPRPLPTGASAAAFLCQNHVCELPITEPSVLTDRVRG